MARTPISPVARLVRLQSIALAWFLAVGVLSPCGAHADTLTLADLLRGGQIVVGDKKFFNFRNFISAATGNAAPVSTDRVDVIPKVDAFGPGLIFVSESEFFTQGFDTQVTRFDYDVVVLTSQPIIHDASLQLPLNFPPPPVGSVIALHETVFDANGGPLGGRPLDVMTPVLPFSDAIEFAPQRALMISTNISLKGDANLTEFMQDYSQVVPEPSTASLLITVLAGLLGVGWWRRYYRSAATSAGSSVLQFSEPGPAPSAPVIP